MVMAVIIVALVRVVVAVAVTVTIATRRSAFELFILLSDVCQQILAEFFGLLNHLRVRAAGNHQHQYHS